MAKKNKELEEKRKEWIEKIVNQYPIEKAIKKIQWHVYLSESSGKRLIKNS